MASVSTELQLTVCYSQQEMLISKVASNIGIPKFVSLIMNPNECIFHHFQIDSQYNIIDTLEYQ
jgi:hypothetical protein